MAEVDDAVVRAGTAATEASLYFVYVLRNAAGILYTGIAKDVTARLGQHNAGTGARFTRGRGPWRICHQEGPLAHGDALRRELAIKADRRFKAELRERQRATARPVKKTARPRTLRAVRADRST